MVAFANLKIGDKFLFNGEVWIKVKPVKKSCCTVLYNAVQDSNNSIRRVFKPYDKVEKVA